jgi:outer membrane protein assembly factor BamB
VYANNGISALAELYVATADGRIFALDANTGLEIRNYDGGGQPVQGLALGNPQLYAAGRGFIRAYDRRNNNLLWQQVTYGDVLSGPFATNGQVVLITVGGQVQFFDPNNNGTPSVGPNAPASAGAALAGNYIFIPDGSGRIAKFRGQ